VGAVAGRALWRWPGLLTERYDMIVGREMERGEFVEEMARGASLRTVRSDCLRRHGQRTFDMWSHAIVIVSSLVSTLSVGERLPEHSLRTTV